jgi:CheY-like chemotaxis protein
MSKDGARLVLVVEDDVSVRRPLVKFLEMHGFAVVTAETSDEGLRLKTSSHRGGHRSAAAARSDATSSSPSLPTL